MPNATGSRWVPNRDDTYPGIKEKNPPAQNPLTNANRAKGAKVPANGQIARVVMATEPRQRTRVFILPRRESAKRPKATRPNAEAKLKPARMRDDVEEDKPIELPKMGRKNGGLRFLLALSALKVEGGSPERLTQREERARWLYRRTGE